MTRKFRTLTLGLLLCIAGCSQPHSPEESVQRFYESLANPNYPELISLFNLNDINGETRSDAIFYEILTLIFEDLALNINAKGGIEKIDFQNTTFNQDKTAATVDYTLFFRNGTTQSDQLALLKDHTGYWQLQLAPAKSTD
ncbi:hypothetical protein DC083_04060 [Ignatzschineria ureiclastica]|uniref:Uncharacterized protein n=1 Tax=Ignatzschineria ureiclastica TaxID=472582 RepID=A0A2U2AEK2_9GAMM|nr:DUF4878 domain-containing protein [Ignatzschineria ureiclastica]PWD81083.1 hypothetical protein DC083_04060 [Ignatzschineria ureiclastica]GGZ96102.1 hypothetical protein GCM10007162_10190 [Ignatzschineria ureiclastica]